MPSAPPSSAPPAGLEAGWPPAPPSVTWPGGPPFAAAPPAARNTGRTIALAVGVTIPVLVIVLAVAAYLVLPNLLPSSPTADPDLTATPTTSGPDLAAPAVGTCFLAPAGYDPFDEVRGDAEEDESVPCDQEHRLETVAVGELEGPRPFVPSDAARDLYDECSRSAEEILGAPWRTMRTWLVVSLPSSSAWRAGAQWYRCDLAAVGSYDGLDHVDTTGNLRETAAPLGCMTWVVVDESLTDIEVSDCGVTHQGEVAGGLWARDLDRSDEDAYLTELDNQCESIVLRFLGQASLHSQLTYWYIYPFNSSDYNQSVLCVVAAAEDERSFTGSVQGVGSGPIPFA